MGYKKVSSTDNDFGSWKGQGYWEEDWGETYAGKRQPALFVININRLNFASIKSFDRAKSYVLLVESSKYEFMQWRGTCG